MDAPRIIGIFVGRPRTYTQRDEHGTEQTWRTAFVKERCAGPVWATEHGLHGDEQADPDNHGGSDKALLAYAADHYSSWQQAPGLAEIGPGGFGENLAVSAIDEAGVCLGDRWRAGDVLLEISQPRQPCFKLARRWQQHDLPQRVIAAGRTGWYLRVLEGGWLEAGQSLQLVARPEPDWTVARANEVFYRRPKNADERRALAASPSLAAAWKQSLQQ